MKSSVTGVLLIVVFAGLVHANGLAGATKEAKDVSKVPTKATKAHWVVSPSEEPKGDQQIGALESDIAAVSAYNTKKQLGIGIYLHSSVDKTSNICYIFRLKYGRGLEEQFGYMPKSNKLFYSKVSGRRVLNSSFLKTSASSDFVKLSKHKLNKKTVKDGLVTIYLDKSKHFANKKAGVKKYITVDVITAMIEKGVNVLRISDQTPTIKLGFK